MTELRHAHHQPGAVAVRDMESLPPMLTADETAELLRKSRKGIPTMVERAQLSIGRRLHFGAVAR